MRAYAPSRVAPARWAVQPARSALPGLWRNCAFAVPIFWGGDFSDLVSKIRATLATGSLVVTERGRAFEVDADTDGIRWPPFTENLDLSDVGAFSILITGTLTDASPAMFNRILEHSDSNSINPRWNIYYDTGQIVLWNETGNERVLGSWPGVGFHTIIINMSFTDNTAQCYIDGALNGSASAGSAFPANADAALALCDPWDGINNAAQAQYQSVVIWKDRLLSAADRAAIVLDPFVMFRPALRNATVSGPRSVSVGLAAETDSAPAITGRKTIAVGLAGETDTAPGVNPVMVVSVGISLESDAASALAAPKGVNVGVASETDAGLAVSAFQGGTVVGLEPATEADTALALKPVRIVNLGVCAESDTASAVNPIMRVNVGVAEETDAARAIGHYRTVRVGLAQETDRAPGVESIGGIRSALTPARSSALYPWIAGSN